MASVAVRPPRFLGEQVPTREQTVQEQLQESLPGYTIESSDEGFVARAKPVKYLQKKDSRTKMIRRGQQYQYGEYIPHELNISSTGEVQKEVRRDTYKKDATGKTREWGVYDTEITDYDKQTKFTYGTRDLKSGRETIRRTSSLVGGQYKEKRIIDQDSAEYQKLSRTPEQRELIRDKGFLVRRTEEYAVAGMSKEQRRDYYKLKAKQRTAQLSLEAKAQKIARLETEKFRKELSAESQKFAMNIVAAQEAQRKTKTQFLMTPTANQPKQFTTDVIPPTPASPTTRTDMGSIPFLIPEKLPPSQLQLAPPPKNLAERYTRYQDFLSQRQSKAQIQDQAIKTVALGGAQFGLGVPKGAYGFVKAVLPWNLAETAGGMVNPETYRQLGQQLKTQPAKTTGEITGALLAGYGVGKGVQFVKTKLNQPKQPVGESAPGQISRTRKDVQTKLPTRGEKFTGRIEASQIKFAKTKTGKGQIESTVFSAKVVKDPRTGKLIRTPEIGIVRYEIPGDPTRLGTFYKTKTYGYAGKPVRVRPEVQQPLIKPQVIAVSKWLPGDVRPVVVKYFRGQKTPFVPDYFGGTLRPFNPQEFTLSTVYPGRPGITIGQARVISTQKLTTFNTPYGSITVRRPPSIQTKLPSPKPDVITIIKTPGKLKPLENIVRTASSPKVSTGSGSQIVKTVTPQKYATASEVLEGSLKVYPKTQIVGKSQPATPSPKTAPRVDIPVQKSFGGAGLIGVLQPQKAQPGQQINIIQQSPILEKQSVLPSAKVSVDVRPESLAKYKSEAVVVPDVGQVPQLRPVTVSPPTLTTETVTELRTETILRTDPLLDPIIEQPPTTTRTTPDPPDPVPVEPPPVLSFAKPPQEEKQKRGKYKVQVRQKGIFKDLATVETAEEAFRIGAKKVLSDSTASLRVQPVGISGSASSIGRKILPKKIFRESKKEPGVFIERRRFRIDAPGEKKEITFKGILTRKSKSRNIFRR